MALLLAEPQARLPNRSGIDLLRDARHQTFGDFIFLSEDLAHNLTYRLYGSMEVILTSMESCPYVHVNRCCLFLEST